MNTKSLLNQHKIKDSIYLKKPASLAVALACAATATPDSAFFVTTQRSLLARIKITMMNGVAQQREFFSKSDARFFRKANSSAFMASLFLVAAAHWELTPGWNVTESHRDFLMPSADLRSCYRKARLIGREFPYPRQRADLTKGSGSLPACSGVERYCYWSDRGLRHHPRHCAILWESSPEWRWERRYLLRTPCGVHDLFVIYISLYRS